jgi:hypothetical protein
MALKTLVLVFWVKTLEVLSPEDGGSMFLHNAGIYLQVHTALHPKVSSSYMTQLFR